MLLKLVSMIMEVKGAFLMLLMPLVSHTPEYKLKVP